MSHPRTHAALTPQKAAVIVAETGEYISYSALETAANQGAHLFRRLGLKSGDTVAVWLPNITAYFEVYWAAQRAGLYIAPLSTTLTADEAGYIVADSGAKALISSSSVRSASDLLRGTVLPASVSLIQTDDGWDGVPLWQTCLSAEPESPIPDEAPGFHMVYSSGTTGRPKGVRQPLGTGAATDPHPLAERMRTAYGLGPDSVYLSPAPLYHTAPLAFSTSCHRIGASVVMMEKFDPSKALAAIETYKVTISQMVPTMFVRMLRLPDAERLKYDLSSLQTLIHAAAPCPIDIKRQMIDWLGPIILEYYGGSEGNGATNITSEEWLKKPGSVGRASMGILHICDESGRELPAGQTGIVYFEGGADFQYHNDPQKTRDARHPRNPGWSTLGDIGYMDADGYLFLTDRKSFMIISGGVNIYPQETENILLSHPGVMDAAVIGVPHAEMGEEVKAVVQPVDPNAATPEFAAELIAWCRAKLSPVKCPRSVDFEMNLPRGDNGKLYKREIRARYWPTT
ncbi:acyl-CoA synthetase [Hyphomonas sp. CACIAM 19H1]|uniref:acyl-CoA synthetase n=1 Tax=Hyphomonas sp. CACIAM 19H1 TaxID=1873716 RepID=UPI000DEDAA15|nr:acyl-CoA synthetase [Hyphomonas sp. CACIAM 19H1]AXE63639.1 acyl-CoA synthetase [Hyphomonas sp. CACIAM 19H1]